MSLDEFAVGSDEEVEEDVGLVGDASPFPISRDLGRTRLCLSPCSNQGTPGAPGGVAARASAALTQGTLVAGGLEQQHALLDSSPSHIASAPAAVNHSPTPLGSSRRRLEYKASEIEQQPGTSSPATPADRSSTSPRAQEASLAAAALLQGTSGTISSTPPKISLNAYNLHTPQHQTPTPSPDDLARRMWHSADGKQQLFAPPGLLSARGDSNLLRALSTGGTPTASSRPQQMQGSAQGTSSGAHSSGSSSTAHRRYWTEASDAGGRDSLNCGTDFGSVVHDQDSQASAPDTATCDQQQQQHHLHSPPQQLQQQKIQTHWAWTHQQQQAQQQHQQEGSLQVALNGGLPSCSHSSTQAIPAQVPCTGPAYCTSPQPHPYPWQYQVPHTAHPPVAHPFRMAPGSRDAAPHQSPMIWPQQQQFHTPNVTQSGGVPPAQAVSTGSGTGAVQEAEAVLCTARGHTTALLDLADRTVQMHRLRCQAAEEEAQELRAEAAQQRARADAAIEELRGSWDALAAAKQAAREAQEALRTADERAAASAAEQVRAAHERATQAETRLREANDAATQLRQELDQVKTELERVRAELAAGRAEMEGVRCESAAQVEALNQQVAQARQEAVQACTQQQEAEAATQAAQAAVAAAEADAEAARQEAAETGARVVEMMQRVQAAEEAQASASAAATAARAEVRQLVTSLGEAQRVAAARQASCDSLTHEMCDLRGALARTRREVEEARRAAAEAAQAAAAAEAGRLEAAAAGARTAAELEAVRAAAGLAADEAAQLRVVLDEGNSREAGLRAELAHQIEALQAVSAAEVQLRGRLACMSGQDEALAGQPVEALEALEALLEGALPRVRAALVRRRISAAVAAASAAAAATGTRPTPSPPSPGDHPPHTGPSFGTPDRRTSGSTTSAATTHGTITTPASASTRTFATPARGTAGHDGGSMYASSSFSTPARPNPGPQQRIDRGASAGVETPTHSYPSSHPPPQYVWSPGVRYASPTTSNSTSSSRRARSRGSSQTRLFSTPGGGPPTPESLGSTRSTPGGTSASGGRAGLGVVQGGAREASPAVQRGTEQGRRTGTYQQEHSGLERSSSSPAEAAQPSSYQAPQPQEPGARMGSADGDVTAASTSDDGHTTPIAARRRASSSSSSPPTNTALPSDTQPGFLRDDASHVATPARRAASSSRAVSQQGAAQQGSPAAPLSASPRPEEACAVCLTAPRSMALAPCGHLFCRDCAQKLTRCAICRAQVASRQVVYV